MGIAAHPIVKEDWYFENQLQGFGLQMKVKQRLEKFRSKYQEIEVMETYDYGKLLTLDGLVMLTEKDEFFYHEIISQPALFVHPNCEKVLIIGGGDCGTLRDVLKHSNVKEAHLCEIDSDVVDVSRRHFDFTRKALDDKRTKLFVEDGFNFLKEHKNTYDLIIVDSTDPIGEAAKLFEESFFTLCYESLKEDGILTGQAGCLFYEQDIAVRVYKMLRNMFTKANLYTGITPTYPTGVWGFYYASKKYDLINDFNEEKVKNSDIDFRYYNEDIHRSIIGLPNYIKVKLNG